MNSTFFHQWPTRVFEVGLLCCTLLVLAKADLHAQTLAGTLKDDAGQALIGGTVLAIPSQTGTTADADGNWTLDVSGADSLRFGYVGYDARTLSVNEVTSDATITLQPQSFEIITVTASKQGNYTSTLDPRNVESITTTELKKAPCCNLGESFETNAAVDVSYRDAATGAREIQVLGLRGVYSQLLLEKRPTLYGLASPLALDFIAGTWLSGIQIGKGASSVQTGPNALSGQINTELEKPFDSDPVFVNFFVNPLGRFEANVQLAKPWNDKHSTGLLMHSSVNTQAHDRDNDGFVEQPGRETYSAMLRHFYRTEDWRAQFNLWGTRDRREGGQTDHLAPGEHGEHHGGAQYVVAQANDRFEAFAKTGYLGFSRPNTSAGFIASATYHKLDNNYGPIIHRADQRSAYLSGLYSSYLLNTNHQYTVGFSYRYDAYDEVLDDANFDREENVTGAFGEYTYNYLRPSGSTDGLYGVSVIAGFRLDNHSIGGWQALPRLNLKVNPSEGLAIRASAGRAYRSPQVIAENIRLLASTREFQIEEPLDLASGWNYGVALTKNFELGKNELLSSASSFLPNGQFTLDVYATVFDNLAVVDQERTSRFTTVANATGPAQTLAILGSVRMEVIKGLSFKAAYKYVHSEIEYADGITREVPYVARWRGLFSGDYETISKRWRFNTNLQVVGPQRLPGEGVLDVILTDVEEPLVFESPVFALLGGQVTHVVNDMLELYTGAENITDFRQSQAIIGAGNEATFFDASRVYAPLMGIMPYVGLRYTLPK